MAVNPYERVPYPTYPRSQTHPDCLAAVATLFGMRPAPVEHCRVLELGSGDGGNLLPMAYALPASQFTGIDFAREAVGEARRMQQALELRNVRLIDGDLREIGPGFGEFDYTETLANYDCVVLATDHDGFDYALLCRHAHFIVDTRGRIRGKGLDVVTA